ncbi:MAG: sulfotransferase domain-containing protein [Planctomycetes bacterium]|nr:sulfotransferase domain-containing protein [Planctomycetota bacterium]
MEKLDFIHIGYQKTATTWLQKNKYFHPDIKMFNVGQNSQLLWDMIFDSDFFFDETKYKKKIQDIIDIEAKDCCYGLSWERLSGDMLRGYDSRRIANRLLQVFGNVKIIITIRNQLDMTRSVYNQYIKMGGVCSLKKFLSDKDIAGNQFMERLKYEGLINYYRELFGRENVYVDCYESIKGNPRQFVLQLLRFLDLDGGDIFLEQKMHRKENKGLSPLTLYLKKKMNHLFYLPYNKTPIVSLPYSLHQFLRYKVMEKSLDRLLSLLVPLKSNSRFGLTAEKQKELTAYFCKSNKKLSNGLNMALEQFNYPLVLDDIEIDSRR